MAVLLSNSLVIHGQTPQVLQGRTIGTGERVFPLVALFLATFLFHGYHPNSQDAAIYTSGIEQEINPSLFRVDAGFIDGHTKLSVFSHVLAAITSKLHIPLEFVLLLTYFVTLSTFLIACHQLAIRISASEHARWCSTLLAAICTTIPVAATSLLLMDSYVTARSFSTPFSLLAIIACLDRSWKTTALWAGLAMCFHPLMGTYLCFFLFTYYLVDHRHFRAVIAEVFSVFAIAGLMSLVVNRVPVSADYRDAALSRGYYFLSCWRWYEIAGLIVPLALMALATAECGLSSVAGKLSATCVLTGTATCLISVCFVHLHHPDLLMRLQVLRAFHIIYAVGLLLGGVFVSRRILHSRDAVTLLVFLIPIIAMTLGDRQSYPVSSHIEFPWSQPSNRREQAYRWIRENTPSDAVFASDTAAVDLAGDPESKSFRATAERSTLNDVKDEGVASLFPIQASVWTQWRNAQWGLNEMTDKERHDRVRSFGATWVLLSPQAKTSFACPFHNSAVAVCLINP